MNKKALFDSDSKNDNSMALKILLAILGTGAGIYAGAKGGKSIGKTIGRLDDLSTIKFHGGPEAAQAAHLKYTGFPMHSRVEEGGELGKLLGSIAGGIGGGTAGVAGASAIKKSSYTKGFNDYIKKAQQMGNFQLARNLIKEMRSTAQPLLHGAHNWDSPVFNEQLQQALLPKVKEILRARRPKLLGLSTSVDPQKATSLVSSISPITGSMRAHFRGWTPEQLNLGFGELAGAKEDLGSLLKLLG